MNGNVKKSLLLAAAILGMGFGADVAQSETYTLSNQTFENHKGNALYILDSSLFTPGGYSWEMAVSDIRNLGNPDAEILDAPGVTDVTLNNVTFKNNAGLAVGPLYDIPLTVRNSKFIDNGDWHGSVLNVYSAGNQDFTGLEPAVLNVYDSQFKNNDSVAVDFRGSELTIKNSVFDNNKTGVYIGRGTESGNKDYNNNFYNGFVPQIIDSDFTGNETGVSVYKRNVDIIAQDKDVNFSGNTKGISVDNGTLNLKAKAGRNITIQDRIVLENGTLNINPDNSTGNVNFSNLTVRGTSEIAKLNLSSDKEVNLNGNKSATDVLNIGTLSGDKTINLSVDYYGTSDENGYGRMDKIDVTNVEGTPSVSLKEINVINDGNATKAEFMTGTGRNSVTVKDADKYVIATSGDIVYTFTHDSSTHGLLSVETTYETKYNGSDYSNKTGKDLMFLPENISQTPEGDGILYHSGDDRYIVVQPGSTDTILYPEGSKVFRFDNLTVQNNKNSSVYLPNGREVNISNSQFTGNTDSNLYGGIWAESEPNYGHQTLKIDNTVFDNNKGNFILSANPDVVTISNSTFMNNTGTVSVDEGNAGVTFTDSIFKNNTGNFLLKNHIFLTDTDVIDNTDGTGSGGIIIAEKGVRINADKKDVKFTGNKGGAINASGKTSWVYLNAGGAGILFENNNSTGAPGGEGYGITINGGNLHITSTDDENKVVIQDSILLSDGKIYTESYYGNTAVISDLAVRGTSYIDKLKLPNDKEINLDGNDSASDVFNIDTLSGNGTINLSVDYNGTPDENGYGSMDKINVSSVEGTPSVSLKEINVIKDGEATKAEFMTGDARNSVTVKDSDKTVVATSGEKVYTFTHDSSTHGLLSVTINGEGGSQDEQGGQGGEDTVGKTAVLKDFVTFGHKNPAVVLVTEEEGTIVSRVSSGYQMTVNVIERAQDSIDSHVMPVYNANNLIFDNLDLKDNDYRAFGSYWGGYIEEPEVTGILPFNGYFNVEINNSKFTEHSTGNDANQNARGSIIYTKNNPTEPSLHKIVINNSSFDKNYAGTAGGAISVIDTDLIINNSEFNDNISTDGGAIETGYGISHNPSWQNTVISGTKFNNNKSVSHGGALLSEGTLTVKGNSEFIGNSAGVTVINDGDISIGTGKGGAIKLKNNKAEISDTLFKNNIATVRGGAIYADNADLTVNNSVFKGNGGYISADGDEENISGGAISTEGGTLNVNDSEFIENSAGGGIGGALFSEAADVKIKNTEFDKNFDRAVYITGSENNTLTVDNSTFTNNSDGAGHISMYDANIVNSTFEKNSSDYDDGGALYVYNYASENPSTLNITGSNFVENTASYTDEYDYGKGGAIFFTSGQDGMYYSGSAKATYNISNTEFGKNSAGEGGALYYDSPADKNGNYSDGTVTFNVENSQFEQNVSTVANGGAIYINNAKELNLTDTSFKNNTAKGNGGALAVFNTGLYGENPEKSSSNFDVNITALNKDVKFTDNSATDGGAIYSGYADVNLIAQGGNILFENNGGTYGIDINNADFNLSANQGHNITIKDKISVTDGTMNIEPSAGDVVVSEFDVDKLSLNGDLTVNLNGNDKATDVSRIGTLSGDKTLNLSVDYDGTSDGAGYGRMDKINVTSVEGTPGIALKDINVIKDGNATKAEFMTGDARNSVTVKDSDKTVIATSGEKVYTFTHDSSTHGLLSVTINGEGGGQDEQGGQGDKLPDADINVVDQNIENNSDSILGGAFSTKGEEGISLKVEGSRFTNNSAIYGGAGYVNLPETHIAKSSFDKNSVSDSGAGGALYFNNENSDINVSGTTFTDNTAVENDDYMIGLINDIGAVGGAMAIMNENPSENSDITVNISDTQFKQNQANTGGAIWAGDAYGITEEITDTEGNIHVMQTFSDGSVKINVTNSLFENNNAVHGSGGAVYAKNGEKLTLTDTSFKNNTAEGKGGALAIGTDYNKSRINDEGKTVYTEEQGNSFDTDIIAQNKEVVFSGNGAYEGGAIYSENSNVNIIAKGKDVKFIDNKGGAIYSDNGNVNLLAQGGNITFKNNAADYKLPEGAASTGVPTVSVSGGDLNLNANAGQNITIDGRMYVYGNMSVNPDKLGGDIVVSEVNTNKLNLSSDLTMKLSGNKTARDISDIDTLSGNGTINLSVDYDGTPNESGYGNMDKIKVSNVEGTPSVSLKEINVIKDGEATKAEFMTGNARNSVTVKDSDKTVVATSGEKVYTFTHDSSTHGLLSVAISDSQGGGGGSDDEGGGGDDEISLPAIIGNASSDINKFSVTTDSYKPFQVKKPDGSYYDSLGTLQGNGREFGISGGNGTTVSRTIDGTLIDGSTKGNGITVQQGQTLNVENFSKFENFDKAINNSGTLNVKNVIFTGNNNDIVNNNVANFDGNNTLTDITGSGTTNLKGGTLKAGTVNQKTVNILAGKLTGKNIIADKIQNKGTVEITGNNNGSNISGEGTTVIADNLTNAGTISQNNLTVTDGKTLNTTADITVTENLSAGENSKINLNADTVNLNLNGKDMKVKGQIFGTGSININGNVIREGADVRVKHNLNAGTLVYTKDAFLNNLTNSLSFNGGGLDTRNNEVTTFNLNKITLNADSDFMPDVDLANKTMDNFGDTPVEDKGGKLHISGMNLISDATEDKTVINFTKDEQLMAATDYTGAQGLTALSPIYKYNVGYDNKTGDFDFERFKTGTFEDYNPSVLTSSVAAQLGGYLVQLNSYDEAFRNMDMYMLMTAKERQAYKTKNKIVSAGDGLMYDTSLDRRERAEGWVRPYASFENVPLKNGPRVSNVMYGSFMGGESQMFELSHGWDVMWGAYAGYNGSHQTFRGNSLYQNGGTLGATGMAYKGNFFGGLTANVGASAVNANTMYGKEDFAMLMTGVAAKTGYNWELADGKFIIQPSYQMSYSFINTFDYTNAAGVKINSKPLHAIQIEPGVKLIWNLKHGWQPYLGVSMVWNILDETDFRANDVGLPELSVDPFVKYGAGVRKLWGERFTGYFQTYVTNGGRNGVGLQSGFSLTLGKNPKK